MLPIFFLRFGSEDRCDFFILLKSHLEFNDYHFLFFLIFIYLAVLGLS